MLWRLMMTETKKTCLYCEKPIKDGRGNPKFCSDTCRITQERKERYVIKSVKVCPPKICTLCDTAFNGTSQYCDYCRKRLRKLYDCKRAAKYGKRIQQIATARQKYFQQLSDEEFYEQVAKPVVDGKIGDWESHYFDRLELIVFKLVNNEPLTLGEQKIVEGIKNRGG